MIIRTNFSSWIKRITISFSLMFICYAAHSSFPVRWTLEKQLSVAAKVALVEVVKVSSENNNRLIRKEATLKVIVDLSDESKDAFVKVVTFNGIAGSDLGLDCVGQKAIVMLEKAPSKYFGEEYYQSVNNYYSVYKINEGMVSGLSTQEVSVMEALDLIRRVSKN